MRNIPILLLLSIGLRMASAQTPAPAASVKTGVEAPKNRAPVSKEVLKVKLPRAVESESSGDQGKAPCDRPIARRPARCVRIDAPRQSARSL